MNELELQKRRVARLRDAIERVSAGNKTAFGKRLGYADGAFVRQMLSGDRAVTEKTIRQIEALPGMTGWFDDGREKIRDELTADEPDSSRETFPNIAHPDDSSILDEQQIDEFARELKESFLSGHLTVTRFALLQGLLREGHESLAGNFESEKQAVGGYKREHRQKRRVG
ncbi:hypothetical protein BCAR13_110092 [Paraburkholderia caribensis]|uniref:hypothetical protein n=1 Tax=Paraburkholderia caribensis TaxID=75105 RepID=UPI001CB49343|nr:hypothetical protein [Paraburkholderia caribensis]CAG9194046.1 hypothetical protein BCAR13_110092 [Paraburkholderia caribensis]